MKRLLVMLVVLAGATLVACATSVEAPQSPATPALTVGVLPHWNGTGIEVTGPITIGEAPWVIIWEFQPDEPLIEAIPANILQVSVRQIGDESYLKVPVITTNAEEYEAGRSYIYDKGTFCLEINSMGGSWDILVLGFE